MRLDAFTAAPRMFGGAGKATLDERNELFFVDYDIIPLLVQQAYPTVIDKGPGSDLAKLMAVSKYVCVRARARAVVVQRVATCRVVFAPPTYAHNAFVVCAFGTCRAADAVSDGDLYSEYVRNRQAWGLLPSVAIAAVRTTQCGAGAPPPYIPFPTYLGKNSSRMRRSRLVAELGVHVAAAVTGGRNAIRTDYMEPLRGAMLAPLLSKSAPENASEAATKTVQLLDAYGMSKARCCCFFVLACMCTCTGVRLSVHCVCSFILHELWACDVLLCVAYDLFVALCRTT